MRGFSIIVALVTLLGGGGVLYFQLHPEQLPPQWTMQWKKSPVPIGAAAAKAPTRRGTPHSGSATKTRPQAPAPLKNPTTLYLTNGGVVTGELVSESPSEVVLRWDYGDMSFQRTEIQRVVKGQLDSDHE